jgi:SpoVK/Ycf46/Vps4 family AAA+-type ATPase
VGDTRDLALILDSGVPLICIESPDERRVLELLLQLAIQRGLPFRQWSVTRGLRDGAIAGPHTNLSVQYSDAGPHTKMSVQYSDAGELLVHIAESPGPCLYALCDLHPYIVGPHAEPKLVRHLKDIALDHERLGNTLVLVSHSLDVPTEIGRLTASFELRLPSDEELLAIVRSQAQAWARQNAGRRVRTDQKTLDKLLANLRGVTHADAHILIRHAVFTDGVIDDSDIPEVNRLKFDLLDAEGVLHYEHDTASFAAVGGLANLKQWLELRRRALLDASVEDRPRGVLLLGVQGSGKSLAAKAVAGLYGVPLLRLDFGALYNKYFGETERNLRNSLQQAELMAPCVLWMDEIEKGLATGDSDNATSKRVLATLLTWMAENRKAVFLVATANDVSALPAEIMRKGRLDEVFFVDLPDAATRAEIFRIHLAKRQLDAEAFDLAALSAESEGFTGAEIEESIVAARYLCAARSSPVTTDDVKAALNRTYPLSVLRADSIDSLRAWASGRTVPA